MCHNFYHSQLVMWASCGTSYSILCGTSIIHQLMEGRSQQTRIKRQCVTSTHAQSVYRNSYNIFTVKIHQKFSLFSRWKSTKVSIWYVVRTGMALCLCVRWAPTMFNIHTTKKSSCPSVFVPAFLQTAVIDRPIPALFASALQSAAKGGL